MNSKLNKILSNLPKKTESYNNSSPRVPNNKASTPKVKPLITIPPKILENNNNSIKPSPFLRRHSQQVMQGKNNVASEKSLEDKENLILKTIKKKQEIQDESNNDLEKAIKITNILSSEKVCSILITPRLEDNKGLLDSNQNSDCCSKEININCQPFPSPEIKTLEHLTLNSPENKNNQGKSEMTGIFNEDSPTKFSIKKMQNLNLTTNSDKFGKGNHHSQEPSLVLDYKKFQITRRDSKDKYSLPNTTGSRNSLIFGKAPMLNRLSSKLGKNYMEGSLIFSKKKENSSK